MGWLQDKMGTLRESVFGEKRLGNGQQIPFFKPISPEMLSRVLPTHKVFSPPHGLPITSAELNAISQKNENGSGASSSSKKPVLGKQKKKRGSPAKKSKSDKVKKPTKSVKTKPLVRRPLPKYQKGMKIDDDWLWRLVSLYRLVKPNNGGLLSKDEYVAAADQAVHLFKSEGVLHHIKVAPEAHITVIGDLHGHYDDFVTILQVVGMPSATNIWLFNGDIVDRGPKQMQIWSIVLFMKIAHPKHVFVTRGNHECRSVNLTTAPRGFKSICSRLFQVDLWHKFLEVFDVLPIIAVINDIVIVLHGGLPRKAASKNSVKLQDLAKIRKEDVGDIEAIDTSETVFMLNEMLWNDSQETKGFADNSRGPGTFLFGPDVTTKFLKANSLKLLVRSHDVRESGFEIEHNNQLLTLFSAPHYCGLTNQAAFLHMPGKLMTKQTWEFGPELLFTYGQRSEMEEHECSKLHELRQRVAFMDELFKKHTPKRKSPGRSPAR